MSDPVGADDGVATVGVSVGATSVRNFGYAGSATIDGVVYHDVDEDLTQDLPFEPGLPFVEVSAVWAGPDGVAGTGDDMVFATTSDGFGHYVFDCLPAGSYSVAVDGGTLPHGFEVLGDNTVTRTIGPGGSASADFGVSGNTAPIAVDDAVGTTEDVPVSIGILGNDSDPEGDPLDVTFVGPADNGATSVDSDGVVTYTPDSGFVGVDTFTYTIVDDRGNLDTATVTVTVVGINEPPTYVGPPDVPVPPGAELPDPPVHDVDEDDDVTITIIDGDLPEGVELIDNQFEGTPTEEGDFEVTLRICDGGSPPECTLSVVTYQIEELPYTGVNGQQQFAIAVWLIVFGALFVAIGGRRERDRRGTDPSAP